MSVLLNLIYTKEKKQKRMLRHKPPGVFSGVGGRGGSP